MGWFKRSVGLDWFDLVIHAGVTIGVMAFFGMQSDEEIIPGVMAASFAILGLRRHFALKKAAPDPEALSTGQMAALRLEEIEERLSELEATNARVNELEDRVEFAERMLAQSTGERRLAGGPAADPARVPGDESYHG